MAIYFQGSEEHWYYFRGGGEQAHSFEDLGNPAKKQKQNKVKASILFDLKKKSSTSGGIAPQTLC